MKLFVVIVIISVHNLVEGKDLQLPSWLDDTLKQSRGKDTDKQNLDSGCTLKILNTQCISTITPDGDSCHRLLNLKKMLKGYWKLKDFYKLTDRNLPAEKFYVTLLTVDNCQDQVSFLANNTASINFLDRYLLLTNVSLTVNFQNYHNQIINNSQISITVHSKVELNERILTLEATKAFNESRYTISINGERITFLDLLLTFRIEHTFYERLCSSIERDVLENMEFKKFQMKGIYNVTKGFYLSATAALKSSGSNVTTYIEIIIVRKQSHTIKLAFILKGKLEEDVLTFLSALLQRRRDAIPVIDRSVDMGVLSISGQRILRDEYDSVTHLEDIPRGIALQTITAFVDITKRSLMTNITDTKTLIRTQLSICRKRDKIDFNPKHKISLSEFLKKIHNVQTPAFPDWLKTDDDVYVNMKKITFTGSNKNKVSVHANMVATINTLFNTLKIDRAKLELLTDKDKVGGTWDCGTLKTKKKFGKQMADVILTCDAGLKNFRTIISLPTFGFKEFLNMLKVDVLPEQLKTVMEKVIKFDIENFRIEASQSDDQFIRITGAPLLFGLQNLTMEGMSWMENDEKKFVVGIVLKDAKLDDLLEKMIGKKLSVSWIGDMKAAILISNTNLESKTKRQTLANNTLSTTNSTLMLSGSKSSNNSVFGHIRKRRSIYQTVGYNNQWFSQASPSYTYSPLLQPRQQPPIKQYYKPVMISQPNNYYNSKYKGNSITGAKKSVTTTSESKQTPVVTRYYVVPNKKIPSIMDDLIEAYTVNNQEKLVKNYQLQKELNEGVLDDSADKRSVMGHVSTPAHARKEKTSGRVTKNETMTKKKHVANGKKKQSEKQRKRSEIRKNRRHSKKNNISIKRNIINSKKKIDESFKDKYLAWLRSARRGSPRENIENIFDDAYKLSSSDIHPSSSELRTLSELHNVQNAINDEEDTLKKSISNSHSTFANDTLDKFSQSQLDNSYEMEAKHWHDNENTASLLKSLKGNLRSSKPEFEREEYGVEREAVAYIPETGADVYNLYKKQRRLEAERNATASNDEYEDDDQNTHDKYARKKNVTDDAQDEEKQNENNDLIQEYAKLNAELAAMHEPTVAPLVTSQVNQQDEIQKKLYLQKKTSEGHNIENGSSVTKEKHKQAVKESQKDLSQENHLQLEPTESNDLTMTLNKLKSIQKELKGIDTTNPGEQKPVSSLNIDLKVDKNPGKLESSAHILAHSPVQSHDTTEKDVEPHKILAGRYIDPSNTSNTLALPESQVISFNNAILGSSRKLNIDSDKVLQSNVVEPIPHKALPSKEVRLLPSNANIPEHDAEHDAGHHAGHHAKLGTKQSNEDMHGKYVSPERPAIKPLGVNKATSQEEITHKTFNTVTSKENINSKTPHDKFSSKMSPSAVSMKEMKTPTPDITASEVNTVSKLDPIKMHTPAQHVNTFQQMVPTLSVNTRMHHTFEQMTPNDNNTQITQIKFVAPRNKALRVSIKESNDEIIPTKIGPNQQAILKHKSLPKSASNNLMASYKFVPLKTNQFHVNYDLSNKQNITMKSSILQNARKPKEIHDDNDAIVETPKLSLKEMKIHPNANEQYLKTLSHNYNESSYLYESSTPKLQSQLPKLQPSITKQETQLPEIQIKKDMPQPELQMSHPHPSEHLSKLTSLTRNITTPVTTLSSAKLETDGNSFFSKIRKLVSNKDTMENNELNNNDDSEDIVIVTKTAEIKGKKKHGDQPTQSVFHVQLTTDDGVDSDETVSVKSKTIPVQNSKGHKPVSAKNETSSVVENHKQTVVSKSSNKSKDLLEKQATAKNKDAKSSTESKIKESVVKTDKAKTNETKIIKDSTENYAVVKINDEKTEKTKKVKESADHVVIFKSDDGKTGAASIVNNSNKHTPLFAPKGNVTNQMELFPESKISSEMPNNVSMQKNVPVAHLGFPKPVSDTADKNVNNDSMNTTSSSTVNASVAHLVVTKPAAVKENIATKNSSYLSSARNVTEVYNNTATDNEDGTANVDQDPEKDHEEIMEAKSELTAFKNQQKDDQKDRNYLEDSYDKLSTQFSRNDETHPEGRDYNITEEDDDDDKFHSSFAKQKVDDDEEEIGLSKNNNQNSHHTIHDKYEETELLNLAKTGLQANNEQEHVTTLHDGNDTVRVLHDGNETLDDDGKDKLYETEDALAGNSGTEVKTRYDASLKRHKHKNVLTKERNEETLHDEGEDDKGDDNDDDNEFSIDENSDSAVPGKPKLQHVIKSETDDDDEEDEDPDEAEELSNPNEDTVDTVVKTTNHNEDANDALLETPNQNEDTDATMLKTPNLNNEDMDVKESTEMMKEHELKEKLNPDEEEEVLVRVPEKKKEAKAIELQENNENSKIITDYLEKHVKHKEDDGSRKLNANADQIAGELSEYASNVHLGGKKGVDQSKKLEKVATVLTNYRKKLKHHLNAHKRTERRNKTMYLLKNKNLQVVMEIRPDSKTNAISVETEGLQNLYKNQLQSGLIHKGGRIRTSKQNYTYIDQEVGNGFEDSILNFGKQIKHGRLRNGHRRHRKRRRHHNKLDEGLKGIEKELMKYTSLSKERNKNKFQPHHGEKETIDDSLITPKVPEQLDDSLVNHKYESILRPENGGKDQYITVGNGSYIENGFDDELKSEVQQIGKVESTENQVFLNGLPRARIYNSSEASKHVAKKNETFSRAEEIIETYSKREEDPFDEEISRGNIKRAAIPETGHDAYNLYNGTAELGGDMLGADELKHSDKTSLNEMETFHFNNQTKKHVKRKPSFVPVKVLPSKKVLERLKAKKDKKKARKDQERMKKEAKTRKKPHKKRKGKVIKRKTTQKEKGLNLENADAASYETSIERALNDYLYPQDKPGTVDIVHQKKKTDNNDKSKKLKETKKRNKTNHHPTERTVIVQKELKPETTRRHKKKLNTATSLKQSKKANAKHRHIKQQNTSLDENKLAEIPDGQHGNNADDVMGNFSRTLSDDNIGNISQVLSDDSPGKQEQNDSIMESFNVWIQNTTGVNFKFKHGKVKNNEILSGATNEISPAFSRLRNLTDDAVTKEIIGTTMKGKSKNLQYSLTQAKRNEGKMHVTEDQVYIKRNVSVMNVTKINTQKKINSNSTGMKISENKKLNYSNNTNFNQSSSSNQSVAIARARHAIIIPKEFLTDELKNMAVVEGVSVDVEFSPPDDCGDDKMCLFIKEKLHDVDALRLHGELNTKGIQLSFKYPGQTDLTDSMSLRNILLAMSVEGVNSNIVIEAELKIMDPPLKFAGQISIDATGSLQFEMSMTGTWKKAFGINNLAIGNALLSLSYQPGAPMPGFELGGDLWFGVSGTGNEIKTKIFFGINPVDPTGNYIFGKTDKLSTGALLKAMNKSIVLPQPIKDSGFPKGLQIAFTSNPKGIDIPKDNIRIQFGFLISGLINILGYEASCKIKITSDEIDININMTPLEFANGLIKMHRSVNDVKNGPAFAVKVGKNGLSVKAEGAACLLGIQAQAYLLVTNTEFKMNLKANLFDLMEGNIILKANANQGVAAAQFRLEACLSVKVEKLMEAITKRLNSIADLAKNAVKRVKEKVKQTGEVFDRAKAKLSEQEAKIKEREAEINSATRQILKNRHDVTTNCFVSCPKVCQGGYTEEPHCTKAFEGWLSCRNYSPCYKRAPDLDCVLKCENEKFKRRGFNLLAKANAKMKLLALAGAKVALKFAKRFADLAKFPMKIADGLLKIIEKLVSVGIEVGSSIAKTVLQDVVQFHHLCISANLAETDGLCVGYNMSISLFKKEIAMGGNLCINGKMFDAIGNDAVEKQYPESTKMEKGLKEKEKDFAKLDKEGEKAEREEIKSKDKVEQSKAKRLYIPSHLEQYYEKILYDPEPTYSFHSNIISAIYGHHGNPNNTGIDDYDLASDSVRALTSDNTSCGNLSQTVYSYNEISKALDQVIQRVKAEKEYLGKVRRTIEGSLIRNELASLNMSAYDKQQYEWYANSLRKSFDRWFNKASSKVDKRQNTLIPKYVGQIHQILKRRGLPDFQQYMRMLHQQAQYAAAGKRSAISTTMTEEENLEDIRKSFDDMLFKNTESTLEDKIAHISRIKRKLSLAQTFNKICAVSDVRYGG